MSDITKLPAKNSEVFVEIGNTPTKLVSCTDWALNCTRNTIDVSTIGTEWKEYLPGQISAQSVQDEPDLRPHERHCRCGDRKRHV